MSKELENILKQVVALYLRYGIKSVTMDDVARHLGISKKTLYQYVDDKTDLVNKVIEYGMKTKMDHVKCEKNLGENAIEEIFLINKRVRTLIMEHNPSFDYDLKKYYPEIYKTFHQYRRSKMLESVLGNINRGKKEKIYRSELQEDIIAMLYLARIQAIMEEEYFTIQEYTTPKYFNEILEYHIRGIANSKGIKYLEDNSENLKAKE